MCAHGSNLAPARGRSASPLDRTVPADASPSFFNRKHAAQGFVVLGTVFGFFGMITLTPDILAGTDLRSVHSAWAAAALVCWFAASITLRRIGPGIASALAAALLASVFLCAGFVVTGHGVTSAGALGFGATAVVVAVLLGVFRRFWGAV